MVGVVFISTFVMILGIIYVLKKNKHEKIIGEVLVILSLAAFLGIYLDLAFLKYVPILGIGILLLYLRRITIVSNKNCTEKIRGTCIKMVISDSYRGKRFYSPVMKYKYNGRKYEVRLQDSFETKINQYRIGAEYNLRVDPNEPENCVKSEYEPDTTLYFVGAVVCIIGWILGSIE